MPAAVPSMPHEAVSDERSFAEDRPRGTSCAAADPGGKPRSLLLVVDHFYPYVGGSETLYWNVTRALVQAGWRVQVITRRDSGMAAKETLEGVEITRVRTPAMAQRLFFQLLAFPQIWRASRSADLIHAVVYASALPAWLAAILRRKPFLLTVHEVFGPHWESLTDIGSVGATMLRMFEWLLLHLPRTQYHCGAQFTGRRLQEVGGIRPERISVIPYTVEYDFWDPAKHQARELRAELNLPADCFLYLYFGRPGASKGVEYLVEAAGQVQKEVPNSRLILLLAREPRERYERIAARVRSSDLKNHVQLLDSVPRAELPGYLLAANCVVVPSISEGFGYSAIEAATLGCQVIATTGHSVAEVLAGGAEFVPSRDPTALAEAIVAAARAPQPRSPYPQKYSVAAHTSQLVAAYEDLLPVHRTSG